MDIKLLFAFEANKANILLQITEKGIVWAAVNQTIIASLTIVVLLIWDLFKEH